MRHLLFLLVFSMIAHLSPAQTPAVPNKKEASFSAACKTIVENYFKKNTTQLTKYVHPEYGIYILYRIGVPDEYRNEKKLDPEDKQLFEYNSIPKPNFAKSPLQFGKLPGWNCDDEVWSKTGFFADSVKKYKPLTAIAEFKIKYAEGVVTKEEMARLKLIEGKCRKVIFAGTKSTGIIFYLSWINGKWYLAVIDTVTTDCSA